jgi:hypothetical protein
MRNGAPGIVDTLKLAPSCGNGTRESPIFAAVNASRNVCVSLPASGGRTTPNNILLAGLKAPGATCQCALWRICDICIAKKSASGSPSVQRRFTEPGFAASTLPNSVACTSDKVRHATTAFNFSVSNRAFAASFSESAARSLACAVALSFSEILISAKRSLTAASFIDPIVPASTSAAPTIRTKLDNAKRESAIGDAIVHISTLWVFEFFSVCLLGIIGIGVAASVAFDQIRGRGKC